MPIITPTENPNPDFYRRLEDCGASVISEEDASHQDIRPARIGILNLMPASTMKGTETRWLRFMSHTVLQIEPVLMKFDDDPRENPGSSRAPILDRYQPFSSVAEEGLDGLIITGDNQEIDEDGELQPFSKLTYHDHLSDVIDWADENVLTTIYSCLASHFALEKKYEAERVLSKEKIFGVFMHHLLENSVLVQDMDEIIFSPHSRWGDVPLEAVADRGLNVSAYNFEDAGWLLADEENPQGGRNFYIQGHPEYLRNDLHEEHMRDQKAPPKDYYIQGTQMLRWANDARALHSNWINYIYQHYSTNE